MFYTILYTLYYVHTDINLVSKTNQYHNVTNRQEYDTST